MRPSMHFLARHRFFSAAFIAAPCPASGHHARFPACDLVRRGLDFVPVHGAAPVPRDLTGIGLRGHALPAAPLPQLRGRDRRPAPDGPGHRGDDLRPAAPDRLPGWGATLAALPVLLDVYQIQLEQEMLASVAFGFLVMAALTLILWWRDKPPIWASGAAAVLLGIRREHVAGGAAAAHPVPGLPDRQEGRAGRLSPARSWPGAAAGALRFLVRREVPPGGVQLLGRHLPVVPHDDVRRLRSDQAARLR